MCISMYIHIYIYIYINIYYIYIYVYLYTYSVSAGGEGVDSNIHDFRISESVLVPFAEFSAWVEPTEICWSHIPLCSCWIWRYNRKDILRQWDQETLHQKSWCGRSFQSRAPACVGCADCPFDCFVKVNSYTIMYKKRVLSQIPALHETLFFFPCRLSYRSCRPTPTTTQSTTKLCDRLDMKCATLHMGWLQLVGSLK